MKRDKSYNTKQKAELLAFFERNPNRCFSAREIIDSARLQMGEATVFRHLSALAADGRIKKFIPAGERGAIYQLGFDDHCHSHFHLECVSCGQVVHTDCEFMKNMEDHMQSTHGFQVDSTRTIIYGLCEDCKEK